MPFYLNCLTLLIGLVTKEEWIVAPSMFASDIPIGPSKMTLFFCSSFLLKSKVSNAAFYIAFT